MNTDFSQLKPETSIKEFVTVVRVALWRWGYIFWFIMENVDKVSVPQFLALARILLVFTNPAWAARGHANITGGFPPVVENLNKKSYLCCCGSFFLSCLLVSIKMVPSLRGSISQTRQEVVPTTAFTNRKSRRSYFSLGHEETKGKLNLQMDNLYQSPH